jgi:hypothetical protein
LVLLLQQSNLVFSAELSDLQRNLVKRLMAEATQVIVNGDDHQLIATPFGANPTAFLKLEGETVVLNQLAYN